MKHDLDTGVLEWYTGCRARYGSTQTMALWQDNMGVSQRVSFGRGLYSQDYSILGSIVGCPCLGKLPYSCLLTMICVSGWERSAVI